MSENERLKQIVELQDLLAEQRKRGDKAEAALAAVEALVDDIDSDDPYDEIAAGATADAIRAAIAQPETEEV